MHITEHQDYWCIEVERASITRVSFDWAVTLLVESESLSFEVRIAEVFVLKLPDLSEVAIDPEGPPEQLAAALSIRHRDVEYAHAFKDGRLAVGLTDGAVIDVASSSGYEPWEVTSPGRTRIVSTPGKGLAIWRSRTG